MPDWLTLEPSTLAKLWRSGLLIAVVIAVRTILSRAVTRFSAQSDLRRRWIVNVRNSSLLILALGLAAVWSELVEGFVTLILALGVGFVIATKEMLLCVTGSFVRTVSNAYSLGDRIEIGTFRGDVIDISLFTTTLLEVGPGKEMHLRTGRTIVLPNAKMLDSFIINESSMRRYVLHVVPIPVELNDDWTRDEKLLLEAADAECASYLEDARTHMEELEHRYGLSGLPIQARTSIAMDSADKGRLLLRFPAPVGRQGRIEQAILRRYLETRRAGTQ